MIAWEYHIMEEVDPGELQRLGELGWELAAIWHSHKQIGEFAIPIPVFYFKRPRPVTVEALGASASSWFKTHTLTMEDKSSGAGSTPAHT